MVWDPKGDGRMTIRAAFGEFNDFEHLNYNNGFGLGPPFGNSLTFTNVNFVNPWARHPGRQSVSDYSQRQCDVPAGGIVRLAVTCIRTRLSPESVEPEYSAADWH